MKLESDTMTAKQRVEATIQHEEPDRVPVYLMGIPSYSRCYKEFWEKEEEIFGEGGWGDNDDNILITPLGDKTLQYYFGTDVDTYGVGVQTNFKNLLINEDGSLNLDPAAYQQIKAGTETKYVDYFGTLNGIKILPNGDSYRWYLDGFLKKKEDILNWYDTYGWPHEKKVNKADVQAYEKFHQEFGDRIYLMPQIGGLQLYESLWVIMGQARFGYYCRKDPDLIKKLINSRKEAQLKIIEELKRLKPKIIFGGDDMGQKGRPLISPAMYRKFFKDPYKEIFSAIHDIGAISVNHSCGNIMELLPDMIEAGLDGWQSLEPASLIDHAELKKKYGDKLVLIGGLDSREISFGTKESLRKHIKEQLDKMKKGGGYITGPTHDFLTETPLENIEIMKEAIWEYGRY